MRACTLALALLVCPGVCQGQQSPGDASPPPSQPATVSLPVRRVVLYKTGVGYFEHQGQVRDAQNVTIRFTSRQLNDVLTSLTTIDPKGRISGISYNSVAPLDQRLGALRLPLGPATTAFDVLTSLRGARIEVIADAPAVQGRLLGIERKVFRDRDTPREVQEFSLLTDTGVVRSYELSPAVSVRVIERDLRQEIGRYLDVIGSTREQDVRNMVISTTGAGERPLFVSYISEVPVWKSTYRLVIPATGSPFLQGWAVVDNTIGEDWTAVELSLVAGSPQSFIQQISQPYYTQRPVVPLPANVLTTPQTHDPALRGADESIQYSREVVESIPAEPILGGVEGGVAGGVMGGVVGGLPAAPAPPLPFDQLRDIEPAALASDLGDLFQYRLKEPVTLQKNQSALVPIVNASIGAEKVSLWNRGGASGHPLRAVWLSNTTGLTLDGGSVTVIDGSAFAGEGLIEPLAASAKRLVSYAEDLGVIVTGRLQTAPGRVSRVRAREGVLIHETQEQATWSYTIKNEEASPATLIIEHRLRPGWKLADGQTPVEAAADAPRFRVTLGPRQDTVLVVREAKAGETRLRISDVSDALVAELAQHGAPAEALLAALRPLLDKKAELSRIERTLAQLAAEQTSIVSDQQRLRENMKALRGSAEEKLLLQRYARQLDEQETRLESLRQAVAKSTLERDTVRAELAKLMASLSFDVT